MGLVHGDLKGVRFTMLFSNKVQTLNLMQANILVSKDRCACLTDFGHVVFEGDLKHTATTQKSTCIGTPRWCPPELFDRRELGFSWGSPTKKSDIYSMAMTIYEVSFLRLQSRQSFEPVLGSDRRAAILRARKNRGHEPYYSRRATPPTNFLRHQGLHR